jgi:hypothetical protein
MGSRKINDLGASTFLFSVMCDRAQGHHLEHFGSTPLRDLDRLHVRLLLLPHRTFSSQSQQLLPTRFSSARACSCEARVGAGLNQAM